MDRHLCYSQCVYSKSLPDLHIYWGTCFCLDPLPKCTPFIVKSVMCQGWAVGWRESPKPDWSISYETLYLPHSALSVPLLCLFSLLHYWKCRGGEHIFLKLHLQHEEIMLTEAYNPPYLIAWNSVLFKYLCTAFSEVQTPSFVFDSLFYNRVSAASIFYKNDIKGDWIRQ